jgi:hypothetical protein
LLLDRCLPVYHHRESHACRVRASPDSTHRAIRELTAGEVPLVGALMALRSAPARLLRRGPPTDHAHEPVLARMLAAGFLLLAEAPGEELVLGRVGRFWKLVPEDPSEVRDLEGFLAFARPGWAKAVLNVRIEPDAEGVRLSTETRVFLTDGAARRRFALYWLFVRPGSGLIRRAWLRAIRRRAEAPAPPGGPRGPRGGGREA